MSSDLIFESKAASIFSNIIDASDISLAVLNKKVTVNNLPSIIERLNVCRFIPDKVRGFMFTFNVSTEDELIQLLNCASVDGVVRIDTSLCPELQLSIDGQSTEFVGMMDNPNQLFSPNLPLITYLFRKFNYKPKYQVSDKNCYLAVTVFCMRDKSCLDTETLFQNNRAKLVYSEKGLQIDLSDMVKELVSVSLQTDLLSTFSLTSDNPKGQLDDPLDDE